MPIFEYLKLKNNNYSDNCKNKFANNKNHIIFYGCAKHKLTKNLKEISLRLSKSKFRFETKTTQKNVMAVQFGLKFTKKL